MDGVERLSTVCKVLFDVCLLELRREHETLKHKSDALKLKVFWLQHDDLKLKQHLAWANDSENGPYCCCSHCYWNDHFDCSDDPRTIVYGVNHCTFMPWFQTQIAAFGLTSSVGHDNTVTKHFALDLDDGEINFALWFLRIPTCAHPDLRKVHDLFAHFASIGDQIEQPGQWELFWA
jgi:hypothetical protein